MYLDRTDTAEHRNIYFTSEMGSLYNFVVLLIIMTADVAGEEVQVTIHQATESLPDRCIFPDTLRVSLTRPSREPDLTFILTRDNQLAPLVRSVDLFSSRGVKTLQVLNDEHGGVQAYHSHGAAFIVKCRIVGQSSSANFQLEGSMFVGEHKYRMRPAPSWHQPTGRHHHHVPHIYNMEEVTEFKTPDATAAKYAPRSEVTQEILQNNWRGNMHKNKLRGKREISKNVTYSLDVLTLVDSTFYNRFMDLNGGNQTRALSDINEYLLNLFTAVNMRLKTLSLEGRTLKVQMVTPLILNTSSQAPYNSSHLSLVNGVSMIDATLLLNLVKAWLTSNNKDLRPHDHAMFITSIPLYGGADSSIKFNITKGLAFVRTMCKTTYGDSSSVIEDRGAYQNEGVVAHELAHSCGSYHDGQNNLCSSAERYIMSEGNYPENDANMYHPWMFSTCSSQNILSWVTETENNAALRDSCLVGGAGSLVNEYQTISADLQCKLFFGNQSSICRVGNFSNLAHLCDEFYCSIPGTQMCERMSAATGTCCGNQKKCEQGQCITANNGECPQDETCPFGDQTGIIVNGKTCAQLEPTYCYIDSIYLRCCETCRKHWSPNAGCEYGDKEVGCVADSCKSNFTAGSYSGLPYSFICCQTCRNAQCIDATNLKVSDVIYTCKDYILHQGNRFVCYNQQVLQTSCCGTCEDARDTSNPKCPWGDKNNCSALFRRPAGYNCSDTELTSCCYTCSVLKSQVTTSTQAPTVATKVPATNAQTATTKAQTVTTNAQTATTKAQTVTTNAQTATIKAQTVTTNAQTVTTKAQTATTKAQTVTTKAQTAATNKQSNAPTSLKNPSAPCKYAEPLLCAAPSAISAGVVVCCILLVVHIFFI